MMKMSDEFAVFILTHGRPDRVHTYKTLINSGYSGKIFLIIDDLDTSLPLYREKFGEIVKVFSKEQISKTFDPADNSTDMRTIVYARNACFDIAREAGIKYFMQLDDDYLFFEYRFNSAGNWSKFKKVKNINKVFSALLEYYKATKIMTSIALAQGGDFIGGKNSAMAQKIKLKRKCMNSFLCSTERPFKFLGRINEDVNTYTREASVGKVFFTTNLVSLTQKQTQSNKGGMTDVYLSSGTYLKSFYSVVFHPSSVTVCEMGDTNKRLHHRVDWGATTPMIIREKHKFDTTPETKLN
jgi:hypothetical protein